MVNQDLLNRLISLMQQGLIKIVDIKNAEYAASVTTYFKAEVVAETITADQYKTITGIDYVA